MINIFIYKFNYMFKTVSAIDRVNQGINCIIVSRYRDTHFESGQFYWKNEIKKEAENSRIIPIGKLLCSWNVKTISRDRSWKTISKFVWQIDR